MNNVETRDLLLCSLAAADLDDVASVHQAAFPKSILTKLGKEAVCRYYGWLLEGPHEIYALGVRQEGKLAGFCFGGIAPTAMSGFLRRNKALLTRKLAARPWLIADPLFRDRFKRAFQALSRRAVTFAAASPGAPKRPFDVLSIAVRPDVQGGGIGKRLMAGAETTALRNGFHVMTLMVHTDNRQAIDFYLAIGWEKLLMKGVWRGNMEKWLNR
ncbi:MAG: GNAT family N-acetyltransferase [Candidatus Eremiobacteraeota bacterium]|nr:GNAT family N-acetyltransferase [Candidatus Eremiobacteraeota bacterium]